MVIKTGLCHAADLQGQLLKLCVKPDLSAGGLVCQTVDRVGNAQTLIHRQAAVDPLSVIKRKAVEPEGLRLGVEPFHFVSSIRRASPLAFPYRILYLSSSLIRENRTLPMP